MKRATSQILRSRSDRPTLFFEVIERQRCLGCGWGRIKSVLETIERKQVRRGNLV
jgi:4-hydroxyphenylpyruvate dioxygenase-like putative hemolysin